MKKFVMVLILSFSIIITNNSSLKAEEDRKPIKVKSTIRGTYLDYFPNFTNNYILVSINAFSYPNSAGKLYIQENNISMLDILDKCEKDAESFAVGYGKGYLKVTNPSYNPEDYLLVIDQYNSIITSTDTSIDTLVIGNVLLFKKKK